jgi:ATP-dependent exoDNAse (exonuclease V) alpha subunit
MQDLPTPEQLLAAVSRFLRDEAGPALTAAGQEALAYQSRVAANMLDTARRQGQLAPAAEAAEAARLRKLLGETDERADLASINRRLAEALAQGRLDPTQPALAEHLWRTTLDKLAVDQPGYETYRRLVGAPPPAG